MTRSGPSLVSICLRLDRDCKRKSNRWHGSGRARGARADRLELVRFFLLPICLVFCEATFFFLFVSSFYIALPTSVSVTQQTLGMTNVFNMVASRFLQRKCAVEIKDLSGESECAPYYPCTICQQEGLSFNSFVMSAKAVEAQEAVGLEVLRGGDASPGPRLCCCVSDA